jgi:protein phosphatase
MLPGLGREGFRHIYELLSPREADAAEVSRRPLWNRRVDDHGPFDIVGDVHGCYEELRLLLQRLGYLVFREGSSPSGRHLVEHPAGRRLVFLGDLAGHGPEVAGVLRLAMDAVDGGVALAVPGDHDVRLARALASGDPLPGVPQGAPLREVAEDALGFLSSTVSHYVLDDGRLVVAHAGMREALQGRGSVEVRQFAIYGEELGESAAPPPAPTWPSEYHGRAMVVYGHTPVRRPTWTNNTINIDTGCVFGGQLTALRYPERELVAVDARRAWVSPLALIPAAPLPCSSP